jgi:hypothetical protein
MLDGGSLPCNLVGLLTPGGSAAVCPNNDCSKSKIRTGPNGQWQVYVPGSPGQLIGVVDGIGIAVISTSAGYWQDVYFIFTSAPPTQQDSTPTPQQGSGIWQTVRQTVRELLKKPWSLSVNVLIPTDIPGIGVGPAFGVSYIPSSHQVCVGLGGGVGTGGKAVNGGPLIHGNSNNAGAILSGFSWTGSGQATPLMGYQAIYNGSGALGGPTVGTPGVSLTGTYSKCF